MNHSGTWLHGRDTDVPGVAMPADPKVGTGVIRIQEFIQPEGEVEHKLYAPGVGLVVEYPPDARVALAGCR